MSGDAAAGRATTRYLPLVPGIARLVLVLLSPLLAQRVTRDPLEPGYFWACWSLCLVYAVVALVVVHRTRPTSRRLRRAVAPAPADLLLLGLLAVVTGGGRSAVNDLLVAVPAYAAFVTPPRRTAMLGIGAVGCYLAVVVVRPLELAADQVIAQATAYAWAAGLAPVVSWWRVRWREEAAAAAAVRRSVAVAEAEAEARQRRRTAGVLHDEVVQDLLVARLRLDRAAAGDPSALADVRDGLDTAISAVRASIQDLRRRPMGDDELGNGLRAVAQRLGQAYLPTFVVRQRGVVPDDLCDHVFVIVRELMTNAAKHSAARCVRVMVEERASAVLVEVRDDGGGLDPDAVAAAELSGHAGLALCRERIDALQGRLAIDESRDGTCVRVELPRAPAPGVPAPRASPDPPATETTSIPAS